MKILKLTAFIILLIGLFYIAYGVLAIYIASWTTSDLSSEISHDIYATGASWEDWKRSFIQGGIYAIGLGAVTGFAGIGIMRIKNWGRTLWFFLSPILLLTQFSEGQKSLVWFKTYGSYRIALVLLIVVTLTWSLLLLPSSRRELKKKDPTPA